MLLLLVMELIRIVFAHTVHLIALIFVENYTSSHFRRLCMVSRQVAEKGIVEFLQAAISLYPTHPDCQLF